jgi:ABC-type sugar transport system substrate-binding protein
MFLLSSVFFFNSSGKDKKEKLPEGPSFGSVLYPVPDEGKVKPLKKSSKPIKIAVLGLENNPFWIPVKGGTHKAAQELKDYNCRVDWIDAGAQHTTDVFSQAIEAAMVQKYDAIACIAGEAGIVPFINKAVNAGIPVATFNSETKSKNKRLFFVGADSYVQGKTAGEAMVKILGGKGKVAVITGFFAVEAHEERRKGFVEYIKKNSEIEIVGEVENKDKGDIAYNQAQDFLNANPDLSAIYVTAGGPFGAAKAIEDAGKTGKVKMISYDFVDETMNFVKKGVITGTIGQNPFAQGFDPAIRLFNYLVSGEIPPAAKLLTRADLVTKENMADFGF